MREWRRGEGERGKQDSLREERSKEKEGSGRRGRKVGFASDDRSESLLHESVRISRIGSKTPELSVNKHGNFWSKFRNRLYDDNINS